MDISTYKAQMAKAIDYLHTELKSIQIGSACTSMLENINVQAEYGSMKIPQMWHISVLDSKTLKVESRDKKQLKHIEKAIYDSELGLTPKNEWEYVLVKVPDVTTERRQEVSKNIKTLWEETKSQIRKIRQDAKNDTKKQFNDKEISEDEHKNNEIDIENLVKDMQNQIDTMTESKIKSIMSV